MALITRDRIKQVISASGTGPLQLSVAYPSYTPFASANLNADVFPYVISNVTQYEVGIGSYISPASSGTTYGVLVRQIVLSNSSGNTSLINFNGGVAVCAITNAAELSVLTSSAPTASTRMLLKWMDNQYELVDPITNGPSLGASINSSLVYYNSSTTNFEASPNLQFYGGNVSELYVNGIFLATAKSFKIPHPIKPNMFLIHGCLEGPEHGIYLRGTISTHFKAKIDLPEYFQALTTNKDYSVMLSSSSIMPVKYTKHTNFVDLKLLLPSFNKIDIEYFIVGARQDITFNIEGQ